MQNRMYTALVSQFESQRDESIAAMQIYLNKATGVPDHSNFLGELKKLAISLCEAEDALDTLGKYRSELIGKNNLTSL
jgi:hypothetical protein